MSTMAEGFEAYHVPQQSRREKLRVVVPQNQLEQPLLPFYDSSFNNFTNLPSKPNNLSSNLMMNMSCSSTSTSSCSNSHQVNYLVPSGIPLPMDPFLYQASNLRELESHNNMVFKPEALSLSLSSHRSGHYGGCVIPGFVATGGSGGPFTGYASVLKDSRFLKPAQELLEEMCDVGGCGGEKLVVVDDDVSLMEPPLERLFSEDPVLGDEGNHESQKKSRLLTMLDEVYRRYRQYCQQMQAVVTSFECVSGLSNAAPYASLAIKAMSKHFRSLKKAISDQLQFDNKAHFHLSNQKDEHFHLSNQKDESPRFGKTERGGPYSQRPRLLEHQQPVWRPQRGLPERAVTVLRAWLFENFLHPYPTDTDKIMLAKQTGLSRSQVSNWFINARVRLWKPMVEEIHTLETKQAPNNSQKEEVNCRNQSNDHLPSQTSLVSENPSTSTAKFQDAAYKHSINELTNIPIRSQEQQLNMPQPVGVGMSMGGASSNNNSVSLTLGLYQNHGIGLAEPFPLGAAQRFGLALETNNDGYVMSGFESQNRHFGRDVIGGQMFHDFVG